jgi:hypothetical protein
MFLGWYRWGLARESTNEWDGHDIFFSSCTISSHVSYDMLVCKVTRRHQNQTYLAHHLCRNLVFCVKTRRQDGVKDS